MPTWIAKLNVDGTIRDIRDNTIQLSEIPTASLDYLGRVVQYIGNTTSTYTRGYFYECVATGTPALYSWEQVDVQEGGGGNEHVEVKSGTLLAGSTSITLTFTTETIGTDTLVEVFTDTVGVNYTNISTTSTTVTLTFDAQVSAVKVAVQITN